MTELDPRDRPADQDQEEKGKRRNMPFTIAPEQVQAAAAVLAASPFWGGSEGFAEDLAEEMLAAAANLAHIHRRNR